MIDIISEKFAIDIDYCNKVIDLLSSELNISGDITIKISDNVESKALNLLYRKKDYPTDVLSFQINEELPDGFYIGDILISYEVLQKQAKEAEISEKTELTTLVVHGVLHLSGYDHETDNGEMLNLQKKLLKIIDKSVKNS